jgi:large subunit ribosomal protein L22
MDINAKLSNVGVSAQKMRLVVDLVRGKPALEALDILSFTQRAGAFDVKSLIVSGIANAEENFGIGRESLYIHSIVADEAPTRKWRRFGARGRFKPILRRSSHVKLVLREMED